LQKQLQEQLKKLEYLEYMLGSMISQETYEALKKESEFQKQMVADYENKLTQLQQKYQDQSKSLEASRQQVSELQTPATIAQNHILNKWKYRTFSR
jgi:predicted  nucleic acid-binding Zn-ribbon protein